MSVSLDSYVVKQQPIVASLSGSTAVLQAVQGKQIWVLKCVLISNGTVNVKFQTGTSDITGLFYLMASTGFAMNQDDGQYVSPWFKTRTGEALNINLSGAIAVGGTLSYILVDGEPISSSSSSSRSSSSSSSSSSCRSSSSSSSSRSSSSSSSSCRSSSSSSRSSSSSSSSTNP